VLLTPDFFERNAVEVAPALLGMWFRFGERTSRLTEVEAYTADDPASHSFRGRTARNASMFGPPGRLYVYLVYGMHWCANIVTGPEGDGQAVLLRGVVDATGPGRLTRWYGIDRSADGAPAQLLDDGHGPVGAVRVTPRVGITKAAQWPRRWVS
jgi:DNA-3-methyladenine glycosylase